MKIDDIINSEGAFLSLEEVNTKFNANIPFTKHAGLIKAIPSTWKDMIARNNPQMGPPKGLFKNLSCQKKITGVVYQNLNNNEKLLVPILEKWGKEGTDFIDIDHEELISYQKYLQSY